MKRKIRYAYKMNADVAVAAAAAVDFECYIIGRCREKEHLYGM